MATLADHKGNDRITIGERSCDRTDALDILAGRLKSLPEKVRETTRLPLGIYQGLRFGIVLHAQRAAEAYPRRGRHAARHAVA